MRREIEREKQYLYRVLLTAELARWLYVQYMAPLSMYDMEWSFSGSGGSERIEMVEKQTAFDDLLFFVVHFIQF